MVDELTQESFQTGKAIVTVSVDLITAIADACKRSEQQNPGMSEEQKIDEKTLKNIIEYQNIGGQITLDEFYKLSKEEQRDIMDYLEEFTAYEEISVNGKAFIIIHAGFINFKLERKMEDYQLYELIFKAPNYERVYFEDKYLVTGHLPTRAIYGAKPDEIYIANQMNPNNPAYQKSRGSK